MASLLRLLLITTTAGVAAFTVSPAMLRSGTLRVAQQCSPRGGPGASLNLFATAVQPVAELRKLPTTYRALWGGKIGESVRDAAIVKEIPMREPQAGEVVVQVTYAGVNGGCETFRARGEHWFADNKNAKDGFPMGAEGVGLVAAVGEGVDGLAVGDAVSFVGAAFSEYVTAQAVRCTKIKEASAAAVAARISGTTAMGAVSKMGEAQKGQVVLVTAAAGAAGSFAVQIAKQLGCEVVGTCSTEEKAKLLCNLGCDTIINYKERDVGEVLASKYPNGVDLVVEHVGGKMFDTALQHLTPKGRLILVGYISEYPHNDASGQKAGSYGFDLSQIFWKQQEVQVPGTEQMVYGKCYPSMDAAVESRKQVQEMIEEGKIKAVVDRREFVGVEKVVDAVDYMLSGAALGKVVVRM